MEEVDMGAQRLMDGIPEEEPLKKKGQAEDGDGAMSPSASAGGAFDCNICLDYAVEPVVTLCGHLYCWPCLYKWLQQSGGDGSFSEPPQQQCCPVCKAKLSQNTLVPLYGGGHVAGAQEKPHPGLAIPRRPSPHLESPNEDHHQHQLQEERQSQRHHSNLHEYMSASSPLGTPRVFHPTAGGVMGGMAVAVLPLIFRDEQWASIYYSGPYYTTSNGVGGAGMGGSRRLRRRETEIERSLHQIWVFLFCCAIICLLMF